jgi:hypothetical protein
VCVFSNEVMVNFQDRWGDQKEDVATNKIKSLGGVTWRSLLTFFLCSHVPTLEIDSKIENLMTVKYIFKCKLLSLELSSIFCPYCLVLHSPPSDEALIIESWITALLLLQKLRSEIAGIPHNLSFFIFHLI